MSPNIDFKKGFHIKRIKEIKKSIASLHRDLEQHAKALDHVCKMSM